MLSLKEARQNNCCRICGRRIHGAEGGGKPLGWESEFGRMLFPVNIVLNYGEEFAHGSCYDALTPSNQKHEGE